MGRLIAWIFEQDLYWFLVNNAGIIFAITVLFWIRGTLIHLSEIFATDEKTSRRKINREATRKN